MQSPQRTQELKQVLLDVNRVYYGDSEPLPKDTVLKVFDFVNTLLMEQIPEMVAQANTQDKEEYKRQMINKCVLGAKVEDKVHQEFQVEAEEVNVHV